MEQRKVKIDQSELINELVNRIATATHENTMLTVYVKTLENKLKENGINLD